MSQSDKQTKPIAAKQPAQVAGVAGRNGVVIRSTTASAKNSSSDGASGYRTYEIHQRERVGESTEKIKPIELMSEAYRLDPYPVLSTLRENYPCYLDWLSNRYWLTRYDDVTSIFADDANFETRPRAFFFGLETGRDLGQHLPVVEHLANGLTQDLEECCDQLLAEMVLAREGDLVLQFAARLPLLLLARSLDIPSAQRETFYAAYWRLQRGVSWHVQQQADGRRAYRELVALFAPLLSARAAAAAGDDLLSVLLQLEIPGDPISAEDVVMTLLEMDHQTFHGSLANLWYLLLSHPQEFALARQSSRSMKMAYLESLRYRAPVVSAPRFARHEVERFGKLIPAGALVVCSAAAANHDPRIFDQPDEFRVERADLCQREPRGQYRADGLASGLAFALGQPSKHPAVPEDRPPSRYALTRDAATRASMLVLDRMPNLQLATESQPGLAALTIGEMHTCWSLPVRW